MKPVTILGIESSCDETSASVLRDCHVLSNYIANQTIHENYGGVVPELASRAHQSNIVPVVDAALKEADIELNEIDAISYTIGPGLIGALMVGSSFAKGLAISNNIPLIEAHHMKAHVLAHFIKADGQKNPGLPFLCLTVSGGHTQIVLVESATKQTVIGQTRDDAAGEAFDKTAKILGLPYPGGPLVDQHAKNGDATKYNFSFANVGKLEFSFSGLKTAVLYLVRDNVKNNPNFIEEEIDHLCASIQKNIVETLIQKLTNAVKQTGIKRVAIAGGVSANSGLRSALTDLQAIGCEVFIPNFEFCTDNAAMIAVYGHYQYLQQNFGDLSAAPKARISF